MKKVILCMFILTRNVSIAANGDGSSGSPNKAAGDSTPRITQLGNGYIQTCYKTQSDTLDCTITKG